MYLDDHLAEENSYLSPNAPSGSVVFNPVRHLWEQTDVFTYVKKLEEQIRELEEQLKKDSHEEQ